MNIPLDLNRVGVKHSSTSIREADKKSLLSFPLIESDKLKELKARSELSRDARKILARSGSRSKYRISLETKTKS